MSLQRIECTWFRVSSGLMPHRLRDLPNKRLGLLISKTQANVLGDTEPDLPHKGKHRPNDAVQKRVRAASAPQSYLASHCRRYFGVEERGSCRTPLPRAALRLFRAAGADFSENAEKETNMVRKAVMAIGSVLLIGGVGYSEIPNGNFWAGITEAFLGLGILWANYLFAK